MLSSKSDNKSTTKSLGIRICCPQCGKPGMLKLKIVKGHKYVIIDHVNTEHSLGSLTPELKEFIKQEVLKQIDELLR